MFRRNNERDTLPSTSYGGGGGGGMLPFSGGGQVDGSGRSIRMDAPIVKAWRKASSYTKVSYYILIGTLLMIFYGYRSLRYWNASIWLTCHQQECTLEVTPPGSRTLTVIFPRTQLHSAQAIKTDKDGNFIEIDTDRYEQIPSRHGSKKNYKKASSGYTNRGPDAEGKYKTYRIKLLQDPKKNKSDKEKYKDDDNVGDYEDYFALIKDYLSVNDDGSYHMHFRHFGLSQTRMRVRSNINKVESYIKRRRQKLLLKESATLPWQAILCLVFGIVFFLLTILLGQFFEEEPRKQGGPGVRRRSNNNSRNSYRSSTGRRTTSSISSVRTSGSHYQRKKY